MKKVRPEGLEPSSASLEDCLPILGRTHTSTRMLVVRPGIEPGQRPYKSRQVDQTVADGICLDRRHMGGSCRSIMILFWIESAALHALW